METRMNVERPESTVQTRDLNVLVQAEGEEPDFQVSLFSEGDLQLTVVPLQSQQEAEVIPVDS